MLKSLLKSFCLRSAIVGFGLVFSAGLQAQTLAPSLGGGSTVSSGSVTSDAAPAASAAPAMPVGGRTGLTQQATQQQATTPDAKLDTKNANTEAKGSSTDAKTSPEGSQPPAAEIVKDPKADDIEFQRFVRSATGQSLKLFGYELFANSNSFSSVQAAPVPAGYILGPGDELVVQVNGLVEINERLVIDRDGRVMVPKVGPLNLAGVALSDAEKVFSNHIGKVFRNFTVSVTMGRLRSIEVFVVGQARKPGKHLVSSLSSLINALFETGGPSSNGSLRAIELRRAGKKIATVDMYAFLARGDNSADVKLLAGDIIFIPPASARAALLGTINAPAIYELRPNETISEILGMSGGLPTLAAPQKAQLERMDASRDIARYVEDFALDHKGLGLVLKAGDIVTVFQISPQIANVVTLQGNVAAPLRYTYKPGMRVADLLNDKRLLIPGSYWQQINQGATTGNYSRPEVNLDYATIQRLDPVALRTKVFAFNLAKAIAQEGVENLELMSGDIVTVYGPGEAGPETENSVTITGDVVGGIKRFVWREGFTIKDVIPSAQWLVDYYSYWQRPIGRNLRNDINWDYAQVVRRVPATLESKAITFNLGGAVLKGNPADNILLEPGDQIALFTTAQMAVPLEKRTKLVTVSGEVAVPGVYQTSPGETLPQLLKRIGGLTPQSYLFGTEFSRESVRVRQQENLDILIRRLEAQFQSQSGSVAANRAADGSAQLQVLQLQQAQQRAQIERLKTFKSNGRVALELEPQAQTLAGLPAVALEDGDHIIVPATPGFVSAAGSVNNENVYVYKTGKTVADVLRSAGLAEDAEVDQVFVLRADGSIISRRDRGGLFGGGFDSIQLMPGDTVVVPAQIDRESRYSIVTRAFKDWTQILSNFGLGVAAINSISKL
ncbi:MAG: SLBB domain-containing protein [Rhodoferax sp.]|nr:SLBB domain-containing protein [Rhodoferax sp.]MDP3651328.1 SLBB domain-containing protein [Rhodoferax sp.]